MRIHAMSDWSHPVQLVELADFYKRAGNQPELFDDEQFLLNIQKAFWSTNCWCFVEQAFAIIAPGCAMRPHLARALIRHPIKAMVAGSLDNPEDVIAQGIACATKKKPYVEPTPGGKAWLLEEWPKLAEMAMAVHREVVAAIPPCDDF